MIALTWTYLPPTCWMTSAYSFSAPTASILPPPEPDEPPEPATAAMDEEQALASGTTPSAKTAARAFQRLRITGTPRSRGSVLTVMIMIPNFVCNTADA